MTSTRKRALRIALLAVGLICIFGVYPLTVFWRRRSVDKVAAGREPLADLGRQQNTDRRAPSAERQVPSAGHRTPSPGLPLRLPPLPSTVGA